MSVPFEMKEREVTPHQRTTLFVRKSDGLYSGMTDWQNIPTNCLYEQMEQSGDYTVVDLFTPVGEVIAPIHGVRLR